jgi:hypothetical protein
MVAVEAVDSEEAAEAASEEEEAVASEAAEAAAEAAVSEETLAQERCTRQYALIADKNAKCLSSQ